MSIYFQVITQYDILFQMQKSKVWHLFKLFIENFCGHVIRFQLHHGISVYVNFMTQQIGITLLIYIMGLFLFVERPFEEEN